MKRKSKYKIKKKLKAFMINEKMLEDLIDKNPKKEKQYLQALSINTARIEELQWMLGIKKQYKLKK